MTSNPTFIDDHHLTLLRAAMAEGDVARDAYKHWRQSVPLDDIGYSAYRLMPLLLATSDRFSLKDKDTARMRGIAKHIWLSNMLRLRLLSEALDVLERAGVRLMVLKGGALFARNAELAAERTSQDYDILVYPSDWERALEVLFTASFEIEGNSIDRFTADDFKRAHAVQLVKPGSRGSIDVHWRALPALEDPLLTKEIFDHAEPGRLAGRPVKVPCLADHLFLAIARPRLWETDELVFRIAEAAHLLRSELGHVDWQRFVKLVLRYRKHRIASRVLRLIRDELGIQVPDRVIGQLEWSPDAIGRDAWDLLRAPARQMRLLAAPWTVPLSPYEHRRTRRRGLLGSYFKHTLIQRAWAAFSSHPMPDADPVAFPYGFSSPERNGRWTDGDLAVMVVKVPQDCPDTVMLEIQGRPFRATAFRAFGGVEKRKFAGGDQGTFEIPVRVTPQRTAVVAFRFDNLVSPAELGMSGDWRLVGLYFQGARVLHGPAS